MEIDKDKHGMWLVLRALILAALAGIAVGISYSMYLRRDGIPKLTKEQKKDVEDSRKEDHGGFTRKYIEVDMEQYLNSK